MKTFECFLRVNALTISHTFFFLFGPKNALVPKRSCVFDFYLHFIPSSFMPVTHADTCRRAARKTEHGNGRRKNPNKSLIRWIVARVALKKRKWKSEWKNETKRHFHIIAQFICTRNGSQLSIMNPHHHFEYIQHLYARVNGKGFHLAVIVSSSLSIVALVAVCIARHDKCTCSTYYLHCVELGTRCDPM